MNTLSYFLFLAALTVLNVSVLYGYFFLRDTKENETIHDAHIDPSLKRARLIQAATFLAGAGIVVYFSADEEWLYDSKIVFFSCLLGLFVLLGFAEGKNKALSFSCLVLEYLGITGFVFLLPDFELLMKTPLSPNVFRLLLAAGWFAVFAFFRRLSFRADGLIDLQCAHIGFSSLLLLFFPTSMPVSLLQIGVVLLPLTLMPLPLRILFRYELPLNNGMRNFFCLLPTGLAFFTVQTGNWEAGVLLIGYVLFELTVATFRFLPDLIFKRKAPAFFYDTLLEKTLSDSGNIRLIGFYDFLSAFLILLMFLFQVNVQLLALNIFFYVKFYLGVVNPKAIKSGVFDLFKEAKNTARNSIRESSAALSDLKEMYSSKKEKKDDQS